MAVRHESDLKLRADAVGPADKNGVLIFLKREQASKRPYIGHNLRSEGLFDQRGYQPDKTISLINVDTRFFISQFFHYSPPINYSARKKIIG